MGSCKICTIGKGIEMPIYEFECIQCSEITTEILPMGTTACRCRRCGDFAMLIPSIPSKPVIRPEATSPEGFPAPFPQRSQATSLDDEKSVRVYDFEFGSQEKRTLERMVDKEMQSGVSDGYVI
jgi:DNA-directed RNA polymerase subunit RPC12/RpoP